jgi:GMP synthase-like glutamine amidotransferase
MLFADALDAKLDRRIARGRPQNVDKVRPGHTSTAVALHGQQPVAFPNSAVQIGRTTRNDMGNKQRCQVRVCTACQRHPEATIVVAVDAHLSTGNAR